MSHRICLVVDDEPAIRSFLRVVLEKRQFQILEAGDAVSALKLIRKLDGHVEFLMTDIRMPGDMNGIDLAHSVRNQFPSVPVILISGYFDGTAENPAGFECIRKPFLPETILQAVERLVNTEPGHSACARIQ